MEKPKDLGDTWDELLFHVRRSVRYHMRRQGFFERWHRLTGLISVVSGSAAVAALVGDTEHPVALFASASVAIVQALDLFYAPADMAKKHSEFRRRFIDLESNLVCSPDATSDNLNKCRRARLAIEAEEPPTLRTLNDICHNEMLIAMGYQPERPSDRPHFVNIPYWHRKFAQFFDYGEFAAPA